MDDRVGVVRWRVRRRKTIAPGELVEMDRNLDGVVGGSGGQRQRRPIDMRAGGQAVEIEGEASRSARRRRSPRAAAAPSPVPALRRKDRPAFPRALRPRRRSARPRHPVRGAPSEWRGRRRRCRRRASRGEARALPLRRASRPRRRACPTAQGRARLRPARRGSAHRIAELQVQRGRLGGIVRNDAQRQHDVAVIADRVAARAVGEPRRRRPQHGHRFHILRAGKIERRRHAGIAGIAPIGLPAACRAEFRCRPAATPRRPTAALRRRSAAPPRAAPRPTPKRPARAPCRVCRGGRWPQSLIGDLPREASPLSSARRPTRATDMIVTIT